MIKEDHPEVPKILALWEKGFTMYAISKQTALPESSVRHILQKAKGIL